MRDGTADRPPRRVEHDLVLVAPAPVLARFERPDDRMPGAPEMLGRVLVRRAVAATHGTARHAVAQVHPRVPCREAVFTPLGAGGNLADLLEMCAFVHHFLQRTTHHQSSSGWPVLPKAIRSRTTLARPSRRARCTASSPN